MSYQRLFNQRDRETKFVYQHYNGDRRVYSVQKMKQEFQKRCRQSRVPTNELNKQLVQHLQRFPTWFEVSDASADFCLKSLLDANLMIEPKQTFTIPIECSNDTDMCDVLKTLLTENLDLKNVFVTMTYGNETIDVPHKTVLMKHVKGDSPIVEALKHQERYLSPYTLYNVAGGMFEDPNRAILVTKDWMFHTRYLYKDWEKYQFHEDLPKFDKLYRICYCVRPNTVSLITASAQNVKFIIRKATDDDQWNIKKDSIANYIDCINVYS